ncbi:MAG TPA: hypothetical protein VHS80_05525 [Chthoniobacterales bacterium]|nr:hypothetical protein [Chthoniobacterales bacterium]
MRRIFLFLWAMALLHYPLLSMAGVQKNSTALVRAGNFLFVPVSINRATPSWWLVDTGAPLSEVDIEAAKALRLLHGPEREGDPVDDTPPTRLVIQVGSLEVGSFSTGGARLTAKALSELNHGSLPIGWSGDFNRNGMIGMDILLRQNAIVDWSSQQIILSPTADAARTRTAYERQGFTYIPLSVTPESHLEVIGRVGNSEYRFYVDSGNPKTLLKQSIVEVENLPREATQAEVHSPLHHFENARIYSVTAKGLQLGAFDMSGHKVRSASFDLSDSESGPPWAGLIGADILWFYDAILDLGKRALYLRAKP